MRAARIKAFVYLGCEVDWCRVQGLFELGYTSSKSFPINKDDNGDHS